MASLSDKEWASRYLLDPLHAPEPSHETGPSKKFASSHVRSASNSYPSPPSSASFRQVQFPQYREEAFGSGASVARGSLDTYSTEFPTSSPPTAPSTVNGDVARRRGSSLGARFPGDQSHRPLDMLRKQNKIANHSTNLKKKHRVGSDSIDKLDTTAGVAYHHDGPYDAMLLARNRDIKNSPIEAVSGTNREALKATPLEMIQDSIEKHRPLVGVADVPPGMADRQGRILNYEEGTDLMIEAGYKRWPGLYSPDDRKGKGEPSFTVEKAIKDHKRTISGGGMELQERPRSSSNPHAPERGSCLRSASSVNTYPDGTASAESETMSLSGVQQPYSEWADGMRRSNTTGRTKGVMSGLTRRFGSGRRATRQAA